MIHDPLKPMWHKRIIAGMQHFEYRDGEKGSSGSHKNIYLFDIEVNGKGVMLYVHSIPGKYYYFPTVKLAKEIALKSLDDKSVLEPYFDKEFYELGERTANLLESSRKLIDSLKNN